MYRILAFVSITASLLSTFGSLPVQPGTEANVDIKLHQTHVIINSQEDNSKLEEPSVSKSIHTPNSLPQDLVANCDNIDQNQLPGKTISCLDHCAHCIRQWKNGVYNGPKCAQDCVSNLDRPQDFVDLDCNLVKYFNIV